MGNKLAKERRRRSRLVKAYFQRLRFPRWTLLVGALVAALMAWQGELLAYLVGTAVLLVPGWSIRRWSSQPGDQQHDLWKEEGRKRVLSRSLDKSGLDIVDLIGDKQVWIESPAGSEVTGAYRGVVVGRDQLIRYTPVHFTVFNFTQHQLVIYQCALDLTTGKELDERVDEYFYKDVVSFTIESRSLTLTREEVRRGLKGSHLRRAALEHLKKEMIDGRVQIKTGETLLLTTSGGTKLQVALADPKVISDLERTALPTGPAEKAIAVVRKMLREHQGR